MNHGHLRIVTSDREYVFPISDSDSHRPIDKHDNIRAELKVINPSFWIRLALMSDLGFAEVRSLSLPTLSPSGHIPPRCTRDYQLN